jgi:hypothetical protein
MGASDFPATVTGFQKVLQEMRAMESKAMAQPVAPPVLISSQVVSLPAIQVKPHPPAKEIRDGSAVRGGKWGGELNESTIPVVPVWWRGLVWEVAYSKVNRILWVCSTRPVTGDMRLLADAIAEKGWEAVAKMATKNLAADKALCDVTAAVKAALLVEGVTMRDVRLAVFSAMGLDSDDL